MDNTRSQFVHFQVELAVSLGRRRHLTEYNLRLTGSLGRQAQLLSEVELIFATCSAWSALCGFATGGDQKLHLLGRGSLRIKHLARGNHLLLLLLSCKVHLHLLLLLLIEGPGLLLTCHLLLLLIHQIDLHLLLLHLKVCLLLDSCGHRLGTLRAHSAITLVVNHVILNLLGLETPAVLVVQVPTDDAIVLHIRVLLQGLLVTNGAS